MTNNTDSTTSGDRVLRLLVDGSAACLRAGREDLVGVLEAAAERIRRPTTVLCVVGEYKQGKSLLVNALVGIDACPVDDDLATSAITVVSHGDLPSAQIRRVVDGVTQTQDIPFDDVATYAADSDGAGTTSSVELVELSVPSRFLEQGLAIVDTPGVNALGAESTAAVVDFLPWADGLVLVSDSSAELSPPELRFLDEAGRACPNVLVALSKIDLYPEWRRIAELDRAHLARLELEAGLIPISSTLEHTARIENDNTLSREAGFPDLLRGIESGVLDNARRRSTERALYDLERIIAELQAVEAARLAAFDGPAATEDELGELRDVQAAVARLEEADAHWLAVLDGGFKKLSDQLGYLLHDELQNREQDADRLLAEGRPSEILDDMFAELRSGISDTGRAAFAAATTGTQRIGIEISRLLTEDAPVPSVDTIRFDVDHLWASVERDFESTGRGAVSSGLSVLLSGSSMMGMLGVFAQVAGTALLGPISWGAAVAWGAYEYKSGRSTMHERQRADARRAVRQLLDRAEIELARRVDGALDDARQALRELFGARLRELSETYQSAVAAMEESRAADEHQRRQRADASRRRIEELDGLASTVTAQASFTS